MQDQASAQTSYHILQLTKELAVKHADQLVDILDQIPKSKKHSVEGVLAEEKFGLKLMGKWEYSLIAIDDEGDPIGVLFSYERSGGKTEGYALDSIYLADLAIDSSYRRQGLGRRLVNEWLDRSKNIGYLHLQNKLRFSLQTNASAANEHVQRFYESFGFKFAGYKQNGEKTFKIYYLDA